ncbi:MAG: hypothetical protein J5835_05395 [Bacteroidales bacterium]|nr:hypothetical protein [Bacteroidales bacterium]
MRKSLLTALAALVCIGASAQFYTNGSDPSSLRWQSTETPFYKIIYPEGADSLAHIYGTLLEQFRMPMGKSIGMTPGDVPRGKMPVVLHTHNVYSNGSVAWAPRRMDLYTLPDAYGTDPYPWEVQLAAHEPRHQAQMQLSYRGAFKVGMWLIGEGFSPVVWIMALGGPLGEGDAVAAETGLATGRTRTADFLNYFRVAYDQGDFRTWNRWCYGSFRNVTPDYYKIGYLTIAGARVFGQRPLAVKELADHCVKAPWDWSPYNFRATKDFRKYAEEFNAVWQQEAISRAPFMEAERVSPKEKFPVNYASPVEINGEIYLLRSGFTKNLELVKYKDGSFQRICYYPGHASSLKPDGVRGRLYWTETVRDQRWELSGKSVVRYYDIADGKVKDLTGEGRIYNPDPSVDGASLLSVEYPVEGGSSVLIISADDGSVLKRFPAPSGVQANEAVFSGEKIYATGVQEGGYALYEIGNDGSWNIVWGPVVTKIVNLDGADDGVLEFVADLSGANELYSYRVKTGELTQVSSLRYGGTDFLRTGDYMYFVSQELDGMVLKRTPLAALSERPAKLAAHAYPVEDALTSQEKALGAVVDRTAPVQFTEPRRYSKILNPLKIHSWAPLYVNYESVMDDSFDFTYDNMAAGATAFFQNDLGTFSGSVGIGVHPDEKNEDIWRGAVHAIVKYSGLYPVIEASLDAGDALSRQYHLGQYTSVSSTGYGSSASERDVPLVLGSVTASVPLSFNKGGVLSGVIPRVRYSVSNNRYLTAPMLFRSPRGVFDGLPSQYSFLGFGDGRNVIMQSLGVSVRGYRMLPTVHSRVYPRLGIGAEAGFQTRLGMAPTFAPNAYGYIYGYLPGLWQTQGLKLSALFQKQFRTETTCFGEMSANTVPRGFDSATGPAVARANGWQMKLSADYAVPFTIGGDLSLMPLAYVRNFVFTPNADFTLLPGGNLWSVGADLTAQLGFLLIALDASVGVTFSMLGGTWLGASGQKDTFFVGPVFSVDL